MNNPNQQEQNKPGQGGQQHGGQTPSQKPGQQNQQPGQGGQQQGDQKPGQGGQQGNDNR